MDYPIPGNDDAIRAVKLIAQTISNAVIEGRQGEQLEAEGADTDADDDADVAMTEEDIDNSEAEVEEE